MNMNRIKTLDNNIIFEQYMRKRSQYGQSYG